ncbi:MAG TPA: hypothetical protein VMZ00_16125, partial [Sporichthya sp.]|nr:hypothetical protein [Sporichthya sp.]
KLEHPPASDRHFLLPLPPGVSPDDPELFGFYSYELRIGHSGDRDDDSLKWWSTANGRFGAPLRVVGLQHPPPALACHAARRRPQRLVLDDVVPPTARAREGRLIEVPPIVSWHHATGPEVIVATATFATPSHDGTPVVGPDEPPLSRLWFCLYAQVAQADATTMRNILLLDRPGTFLSRRLLAADRELADLFPGRIRTRSRDRTGFALFRSGELRERMSALNLPATAPLSILAVELLPSGTGIKVGLDPHNPEASPLVRAGAQSSGDESSFPFGRIMRVSTLSPVLPVC